MQVAELCLKRQYNNQRPPIEIFASMPRRYLAARRRRMIGTKSRPVLDDSTARRGIGSARCGVGSTTDTVDGARRGIDCAGGAATGAAGIDGSRGRVDRAF